MKKCMFKSFIVLCCIIFLSSLCFSGCKSTILPILNQNKVLQENIYKEYINLGNAYFEIERYSDALKFYEKALEDDNLYKVVCYKMAQCYIFLSDWENALAIYETILAEDPDNLSIKANIAYIYSVTGDFEEALFYYEDLLFAQPENITYLENYLAIILSDVDILFDNEDIFVERFHKLKNEYPENKNIVIFQGKYDEYLESFGN